jgi:hypothetical protein
MRRLAAAAACVACCLRLGPAQANRPLVTDTADTVSEGRCQFEPYAGRDRSGGSSERFGVLQLNCGVTAGMQLGASAARDASGDDVAHTLAASGKTNLVALEAGRTGIALGYGASAERRRGRGWSGEGAFVYAIASREAAEGWLLHANLGSSYSRSARQASTTWALATEYAAARAIVLSAELYGDDRTRAWAGVGALWQIHPRFSVNASYAEQNTSPRTRQWTAGFLIEF